MPSNGRVSRQLWKAADLLREPRHWINLVRDSLHERHAIANGPPRLPVKTLGQIVSNRPDVTLVGLHREEGNVSYLEMLTLAAIVAANRPERVLEIGTFDGNTTLQMAANTPPGARIFTLDLPVGATPTAIRAEDADRIFIGNEDRGRRRYANHPLGAKIVELTGDSATFDFEPAIRDGRPNLVFIDGSHSYEYVRSDTEKVLKFLAPSGIVLWHDYTGAWPGVRQYLGELSATLPIVNIEGTTLAYYQAPGG